MQKIDWVLLGGLAMGGIIGVFLLHSVVPVVAKPADPKKVSAIVQVPSAYPFDSPEGWNWDLNYEKVAKDFEVEATQSPYWRTMGNENYNPHGVY